MSYKSYIFEGRVTALSSIAHSGGQSLGITSKLRREKFVQADGSVEKIPVLSGNGVRGMLRDRGMLHMCRALGFGTDEETGEVRGLSLPAFYFLFSGGSLTRDSSRGLDIDLERKLHQLIPLVGLFGGALGNMILPGKVKVGKMIPICAETVHLLPDGFRLEQSQSIWEYLDEEMYTRKDDAKNKHLLTVLEPSARALVDATHQQRRLEADEPAAQANTGQRTQMMYYTEVICAGTPFYWKLVLDDVTDLEYEAFLTTLVEFSRKPYVGGKSAVGLGEIAVKFDNWIEIEPRAKMNGTAVGFRLGTLYQEHLDKRAGDIMAALGEIG